jgi:hypothetical protein
MRKYWNLKNNILQIFYALDYQVKIFSLIKLEEFTRYIKLVNALDFKARPDYSDYRHMFQNLLSRHNIFNDSIFDWMIPKKERNKYIKEIKRKFRTAH